MSSSTLHTGFEPGRLRHVSFVALSVTRRGFLCFLCFLWPWLFGCAKRESSPLAGVLRISQRNEPATLDPQLATLPDEYFTARALLEGLTTPDPAGGEPRPAVATRWSVSPDGLVWTFHLRPEARWSNGDPVTARDFIWSFRRLLTPSLGAAKAPLFFPVRHALAYLHGEEKDFSRVGFAAPDPHTLVVTLAHPAPYLPRLAATGAWLPVHPPTLERHGAGRDSRWSEPGKFVGNGPYVLTTWRRAQQIGFQRNPHYWDRAAVLIPAIRLVIFDNNDAEERSFRAGQLDITMTVPAARLDHYARSEPDLLRRQPLLETRYLALNLRRGPLADVRVRRALALAVDRAALTRHVLGGGQQAAWSLIPPGLGGYQPADHLTRDAGSSPDAVAEARRLLTEAGFPDGRGFPRLEFSTWTNTPVLEAVQQMWKQNLGIDTAITLREGRAHLGALAAGDFDLALMPLIPDYDDAGDAFSDFLGGAPANYARWNHPGYDDLVTRAGRTLDPAARLAGYHAAEGVLLQEMPAIPLYYSSQNFLVSPRVRGWQSDRLWTRYYKRVTLASGR